MLYEKKVVITAYRYYAKRTKMVGKMETMNDRGTTWKEWRDTPTQYEVEVSKAGPGTRNVPYKKEISLMSYVLNLTESDTLPKLKKAIGLLQENLAENEWEDKKIDSDYKLSEQYKEELKQKVIKDNKKTKEEMERIQTIIDNKDIKKTKAAKTKARNNLKKEIQLYIDEKFKYSEKYIAFVEGTFIKNNPEFNIEFQENKVIIKDPKGLLKDAKVLGEWKGDYEQFKDFA